MRATGAQPLRVLAGSFVGLIAAGAVLLSLPAATPEPGGLSWIDAVFTATSAVCVTGLVVRDTGTAFTPFGQVVILLLIQLGGLGIMTFSLLVFSLFSRHLSLTSRFLVSQTLGQTGSARSLWSLLLLVLRFTLVAEGLGAALLFAYWWPEMGPARAAWAAVFHSVSAFCNAGFALWSTSLEAFRDDVVVNVVVATLIVLGGLGFLVVREVLELRGGGRLSLHGKLALSTHFALAVLGAAALWILERADALAAMPLGGQLMAALFQSVTARTAGFNTLPIAELTPAGLFVLMLLMFVGGSPGSCAGGIKTTTLAVLAVAAWSRLRGRRHVSVFRRTVGRATLENTVTILVSGTAIALVGLFGLLFLQAPHASVRDLHGAFVAYLFETISALGTVGLSVGVTSELTPASRVLVTILMFVGRLGPLTAAAVLSREASASDWQYPEEEVVVG